MTDFRPRPAQKRILAYRGGRMGVSAVPGAGKTHILAVLAARLVTSSIAEDQEVLVVTLVNSAVDNIKQRIARLVGQRGLLANVGYRVRTLHGLAHDIVRERPELVGLADDFKIVDEREAEQMRDEAVEVWLSGHPDAADLFISGEVTGNQREWVARERWPEVVRELAGTFIRRAKDLRLTPQELLDRLGTYPGPPLTLAQMCAEVYDEYQSALYRRGGVDFDDLIRLALVALEADEELLARLRHRWPFILEDEAQDSSYLQEAILRLLAGPEGNWVRVGDPNQAINTTFTTADPRYLRNFLHEPGVTALPLQNSGRSQQCIIDLANYLVEWTMHRHPEERVRDALSAPPYIEPTPPDDPQPNPPSNPDGIHIIARRYSPDRELADVIRSLGRWLSAHPEETVAILVPRNKRGFDVTDALTKAGIPYVELLRSTTSTRKTAGALAHVLRYLANPTSASSLAQAFAVWRRDDREEREAARRVQRIVKRLRKCRHVEEFLWPRGGADWLERQEWDEEENDQVERAMLAKFRELVRRWQGATLLPIDQLILTVAQDLFTSPGELALSHKLAVMLRTVAEAHPEWRLPELIEELVIIARNQRRFLGFAEEDTGFEPQPGVVTVATLHKAKGLEWDRVYLMSVNNYNFPSAQPHDEYIAEKWFIRGRLNLEAEALAQLESLVRELPYREGEATRMARLDYVAERLRLLYVGITRARKELIITWNVGRGREPKQMAVPLIALHTWWEGRTTDTRQASAITEKGQ